LKKLAMDTVIGALSEGTGTAFTGDSDPQLVGDALPFALKLYETLLAQSPDNEQLLLTTGSGFVMYANAFVQMPADMLPPEDFQQRSAGRTRAKNLYLRGRDYVLTGLDLRHPGFLASIDDESFDVYLAQMKTDDVPFLYWAGAGWIAAIGINAFDVELGITRESAIALLLRALELDEAYSGGAIHEVLISYYGSMPAMLGGSEEKARNHFERAVELSRGTKPGPYVALAQAVSIKNQNADEFRSLLETALSMPDDDPDQRLVTVVMQNKAQWLLDHIEDYFLLD
jgi:predicted anti-sigma-YlaC factor YlaD